jgi:hypothetical protein
VPQGSLVLPERAGAAGVAVSLPGRRLFGHSHGVRRIPTFGLLGLLLALGLGCSGRPVLEGPAPRLAPPPAPPVRPLPPTRLYRDDVVQWVDRGFGHFLQMVEVEPRVFDGKFTGWTIVGLYPRDFWRDVDLREGDVVTRVNGLPIERETEAFSAFQGLKQAKELTVALERDGQAKKLHFPIVERAKH